MGAVDCQPGGREAINVLMAPICRAYEHSSSPIRSPFAPRLGPFGPTRVPNKIGHAAAFDNPVHSLITLRDEDFPPIVCPYRESHPHDRGSDAPHSSFRLIRAIISPSAVERGSRSDEAGEAVEDQVEPELE
jgi:hypothetical protein